MIGATVVFLVVLAIVGSYITIVNRMLRSDEHWAESSPIKPGRKMSSRAIADAPAALAHA